VPYRAPVPRRESDGSTRHPDSLVPSKGSSLTLGEGTRVDCCIDPQPRRILFVMARYLPIIIVALLMIYCVVEVAQAPPYAVRRMPRWLWATAIICLPLAGAVCWLLLGRPTPESSGSAKPKQPPKAPDDDIDFLRGL
jgi:hypothetical protein